MQKPSFRRRIRRIVRKHFGPKQQGLVPVFKDSRFTHSHVRAGKRGPKSIVFPKGKPKAIVVTKFRTMKRGAHADFGAEGRNRESKYTWFGRIARPWHLDEAPQIIDLLTGKLVCVGLRPMPPKTYRRMPKELREIYDDVGPGLMALPYACESSHPTLKEVIETCQDFYKKWKKNKRKAYSEYANKIKKNATGKEIILEDLFEK